MEREVGRLMGERVEPCLRKEVCQPRRVDEAEWRCDGCGAEIWFMRSVDEGYERPPGAAEDSRRLAAAMIEPEQELWPPDFSDLKGHPRPGAGVPDDPQVRIAEELLASPPVGLKEIRMEIEGDIVSGQEMTRRVREGETEEEMITRICAEVRAEPIPRQNAGGPGCWRTPEPEFE